MDTLKHAFSKSRSASASSPLPKPRDLPPDGGKGKSPQRVESMSPKRDSGLGKSILASLGSTNGRNHSRKTSGASSAVSGDRSFVSANGPLNVSDRLEAILARTDDLDAANVAHLAQSISEIRGKSHGLHGIHPGLLAKDTTPPHSSHLHSPTQQEFVDFSPSTISRTRKCKSYFETKMMGMRVVQNEGRGYNPLQFLRDREVRRITGEHLDTHIFEGRLRDHSKAGSLSSYPGADSVGEGRTRGQKRRGSPPNGAKGHVRQQSSRHHADARYRTNQKGLEHWTITPEEYLANISWEQANPHRMVNRKGELIHPVNEDHERRSDGTGSKGSSFEYDRRTHPRYSSDGFPLSPQVSLGSPLAQTTSLRSPIRPVPSFAMSSTSVNRSRSPSPTRSNKHTRQASDLPARVRKRFQEKFRGEKGDKGTISSRVHSPTRSDIGPPPAICTDEQEIPRSMKPTYHAPLRLDIDILRRRPTLPPRPLSLSLHRPEHKRELARTRARQLSIGITTRGMLPDPLQEKQHGPIAACHHLINTINTLNNSLTTCFDQTYPTAMKSTTRTLEDLETRQNAIATQVQSSLAKTRTETSTQISEIASEQTSTLLLQLKAVEDKMDGLEYRTNSGWTHEKTLRLIYLLLEYVVMVVLWHVWVLISALRLAKRLIVGGWAIWWAVIMGLIHFLRWLFFLPA